jgi:DNA/RNA endonuclease G (NUC1)
MHHDIPWKTPSVAMQHYPFNLITEIHTLPFYKKKVHKFQHPHIFSLPIVFWKVIVILQDGGNKGVTDYVKRSNAVLRSEDIKDDKSEA